MKKYIVEMETLGAITQGIILSYTRPSNWEVSRAVALVHLMIAITVTL